MDPQKTGNEGLFRKDQKLPKLYNDFRFQVCLHIWAELIKKDANPAGTLTAWLITTTGNTPMEVTDRQWIDVQNSLGKILREGAGMKGSGDMPAPPANLEPYVKALGVEGAMALFLSVGGSEIYLPKHSHPAFSGGTNHRRGQGRPACQRDGLRLLQGASGA
ncbi:hypothetical protein [uncultured Roseibium sp.]|uniref:hypothetical protein n=1 Tax=uncultured Roseibium sp. TaxID=1936171 RepID=UPI0032168A64